MSTARLRRMGHAQGAAVIAFVRGEGTPDGSLGLLLGDTKMAVVTAAAEPVAVTGVNYVEITAGHGDRYGFVVQRGGDAPPIRFRVRSAAEMLAVYTAARRQGLPIRFATRGRRLNSDSSWVGRAGIFVGLLLAIGSILLGIMARERLVTGVEPWPIVGCVAVGSFLALLVGTQRWRTIRIAERREPPMPAPLNTTLLAEAAVGVAAGADPVQTPLAEGAAPVPAADPALHDLYEALEV